MKEDLEGKSLEELFEMQMTYLNKMAGSLCELITREIDNDGTKKRVRAWLKSLRNVHGDLIAMGAPMLESIKDTEKEAEDFLFQPKKGE